MQFPTYTKTWHNDVYADISASRPELSVKGKRVVVTGGGGVMGTAIAEGFAVAGAAEVVILGRTENTLRATQVAVSSRHPNTNVVPIVMDICSPTSTGNAFAAIAKRGPIDIYVNNAAHMADLRTIEDVDPESWWTSFEVNVKGSSLAVKQVLKNISNDGVLINVSSAAAHVPSVPAYSGYSTSKIASIKMFEHLQSEHPELRVFSVQPAVVPSKGLANGALENGHSDFPLPDQVELPGNFIVWLASPEAAFLKGKFVWANWDVNELKEKEREFEANPMMLTLGLCGWPQ